MNLLILMLGATSCPQEEEDRKLELGEKLDEQRRVLEREHEETLQGKNGDSLLPRVWRAPSFVPTFRVHKRTPTGSHLLSLAPPSLCWALPLPLTAPSCLWSTKSWLLQGWSLQGPWTCPFGHNFKTDIVLCLTLLERFFSPFSF